MLVLKLIGVTFAFLALAFLGLGIRILFKKNGSFPEHRVGHNKEMRKRKIYCVKTQDKIEQNKIKKEQREKRLAEKLLIENTTNESTGDFSKVTVAG